jgi:hypothetical protein
MNRRAFIKGLIALASAPAIGKYVNVFKTEGAREGIEQVASHGVDFFNMVIKKVMNEGKLIKESDRIQTFKHPDRPDINVEVDLGSGSSSVYFDTDRGTKAGAEIVKDIEVGPNYSELLENEEIYKTGAGGEVYKDIDEQITGGITNLEEFLKKKKGFAAGGRVGFSGGGIFRGLKGIQLGKVQKDLIKKYKDQGMDFIEAVTKGTDEGTQLVNKKKLDFLKTKFDDTNVYSDDYVKLIDEEIRLNDPEMFKDIRQFELNGRPELADKMRALRHPDWAEANFGEDYLTVLENRQVQGINRMMEDIDPNIKERSVLDDIDDMNRANIDDLFGRKKNAAGGRVGMFRGGVPKGLQAALRAIMEKYGTDSIKVLENEPDFGMNILNDYNIARPESAVIRDKMKNFGKPGKFNEDGSIDYDYYAEILNDSENTFVYGDETIEELEKMAKERLDEIAEYKAMYDRGELDKYAPSKFDNINDDQIAAAVDDIFPTGDIKLDAEMAAESLVENNSQIFGDVLYEDLDNATRSKIYGAVLEVLTRNSAKMRELQKATKPEKTLASMKAGKGINMSDPEIADEFSRFMKETDPKGYKDLEQKVELSNFNPKGRKKNADGGSVDGDVSLTVIKIPDISESGVESLFKRR